LIIYCSPLSFNAYLISCLANRFLEKKQKMDQIKRELKQNIVRKKKDRTPN